MFTHKHTRSQTGTTWPLVPQQRERCLLFDSVSAGPDKLSCQLSTELVLPPADQRDVSTLLTMWPHLPRVLYAACHALLCLINERPHTLCIILLNCGVSHEQRHRYSLNWADFHWDKFKESQIHVYMNSGAGDCVYQQTVMMGLISSSQLYRRFSII